VFKCGVRGCSLLLSRFLLELPLTEQHMLTGVQEHMLASVQEHMLTGVQEHMLTGIFSKCSYLYLVVSSARPTPLG